MAIVNFEERLKVLESRQDALQRLIEERLPQAAPSGKRGWEAIVGTFADDPLYEEAMRLGRKWRESKAGGTSEETP